MSTVNKIGPELNEEAGAVFSARTPGFASVQFDNWLGVDPVNAPAQNARLAQTFPTLHQ